MGKIFDEAHLEPKWHTHKHMRMCMVSMGDMGVCIERYDRELTYITKASNNTHADPFVITFSYTSYSICMRYERLGPLAPNATPG